MSADHESSYYEIALTNRQVLTIFVVLLTCLVAAFLSGVWIGRRDGGQAPLEASLAETVEEPTEARVTELNFFSEGSSRGADDAGETRQRPAQPPAKEQESEPPPAPPPARESEPATRPAPPRTTSTEAQPSGPAATAGGRVIQVFSTVDAAQADKLVRRLGEGGYPAYLVEENLQGRTTYRVRVGPYLQEERAKKIADELRREYRLETWITSQGG